MVKVGDVTAITGLPLVSDDERRTNSVDCGLRRKGDSDYERICWTSRSLIRNTEGWYSPRRPPDPADGDLVLLLHGFPQTKLSMRSQVSALADAGYRAVAVDQRGYSPGARPAGWRPTAPTG